MSRVYYLEITDILAGKYLTIALQFYFLIKCKKTLQSLLWNSGSLVLVALVSFEAIYLRQYIGIQQGCDKRVAVFELRES